MSKNSVSNRTFLDWVNELDRWSTVAREISPQYATATVLGSNALEHWIEEGYLHMDRMATNIDAHQQLTKWMTNGMLDPLRVFYQLQEHHWEYTLSSQMDTDGDGSGTGEDHYIRLDDTWATAAGRVMVLSKMPVGDEHKPFVLAVLSLFSSRFFQIFQTELPHIDASHHTWMEGTCAASPDIRDAIATNMLTAYGDFPLWPWVFGEDLKDLCSLHLVGRMLAVVDHCKALEQRKITNSLSSYHDRIALFRSHAPELFLFIQQASQVHESLAGPPPSSFLGIDKYMDSRALAVHSMIRNQMADGIGVDQDISSGHLFSSEDPTIASS